MSSQGPLISVIIPCYNSGMYIGEAVASVKLSSHTDYELIIVNDGSTDTHTLNILDQLEREGCKIYHQRNGGPAAARNAGVKQAQGEYLFFLDSDNKIRPDYLKRGIEELNKDDSVGVVYGSPNFFGDSFEPRFQVEKFDMDRMIVGNYIDMCAVVRKKVWDEVGGFDEERVLIGYEDWDFWIRVGLTSWKFKFIEEVLFDYRIRDNSLSTHIVDERKLKVVSYITSKHSDIYFKRYKYYYRLYALFHKNPFLYFAKVIFSKFILKKKYLP